MPSKHSSIDRRPGNKHQRLHAPASIRCQMASRKTLLAAAAMALVATAALLPATASSKKTFTVGDDSGWDVGVDYDAWASGKNFKVGDTLVFRHDAGQDVVQVFDEQSFDDCVTPDNGRVLGGTANVVHVVLGQKGRFFFICDAEGECASGMKLAVNVH